MYIKLLGDRRLRVTLMQEVKRLSPQRVIIANLRHSAERRLQENRLSDWRADTKRCATTSRKHAKIWQFGQEGAVLARPHGSRTEIRQAGQIPFHGYATGACLCE